MTAGRRSLSTPTADLTLTEKGLIVVRFHDGSVMRGDDMRAVTEAAIELSAGVRRCFLVDARGVRSADREARRQPARPELVPLVTRTAILVGNPVTRVIVTFFNRVSAPVYPSRIFDDESEALAWLLEEARE